MSIQEIGIIVGLSFTSVGAIFAIYNFFKVPQEDIEKKQAVAEKEIGNKASILAQKEADGRALLLSQQVQWEKEANEKKFTELGKRIDTSMTLAQNHIHSVDLKVDKLIETVGSMSNKITELSTIINERIPRS